MNNEDIFYMIWCPQALTPTVRHETLVGAQREADRLARANRGRDFIVMGAIELHKAVDVTVMRFTPELPF